MVTTKNSHGTWRQKARSFGQALMTSLLSAFISWPEAWWLEARVADGICPGRMEQNKYWGYQTQCLSSKNYGILQQHTITFWVSGDHFRAFRAFRALGKQNHHQNNWLCNTTDDLWGWIRICSCKAAPSWGRKNSKKLVEIHKHWYKTYTMSHTHTHQNMYT